MRHTLLYKIMSFHYEIIRLFIMSVSTAIMQAFRDIIQWFLDHLAGFTATVPVPNTEDCDRPNDKPITESSAELAEGVLSTVGHSRFALAADAAALPAESLQPPSAKAPSSDAPARVSALPDLACDRFESHEDISSCQGNFVQENSSISANVEADLPIEMATKPSALTATEASPSNAPIPANQEECGVMMIIKDFLAEMIQRVIESQSNDSLLNQQRHEVAGKEYQPMPFPTWEERQQQDREEIAEFEAEEAAAIAQLASGDLEEEFNETEEKSVATALEEVEENASSLKSVESSANAQSGVLSAPVLIIPTPERSAANASSVNRDGSVAIAPSSPIHRARTDRATGARNGRQRVNNAASAMGPRAMIKALEDGWKISYRADTVTTIITKKTSEKPSKKKERKSVVISSTACSRARVMPSRKAGIKAGRAGVKQALQWK
jgi:hypothetical protein